MMMRTAYFFVICGNACCTLVCLPGAEGYLFHSPFCCRRPVPSASRQAHMSMKAKGGRIAALHDVARQVRKQAMVHVVQDRMRYFYKRVDALYRRFV